MDSAETLVPDAPGRLAKMLGGVAMLALVLGAFLYGRDVDDRASGTPPSPTLAPATTARPTTTAAPTTAASQRSVVDLLGPGRVLDEVELDLGRKALLVCRDERDSRDLAPSVSVVHVGHDLDDAEFVISITEITHPSGFHDPCDTSCRFDQVEMDGQGVLFGDCLGLNGATTGFAIATPRYRWQLSPLGLDLSCGGTSLTAEGDTLVLTSWPVRSGPGAPQEHAPVRFTRENGEFVADDPGLLGWYCDINDSQQIRDRWEIRSSDRSALASELVDSEIGEVGVHGPVLIGTGPEQCALLQEAWWDEDWIARVDTRAPISDLTGLAPRAGSDDWYWTCEASDIPLFSVGLVPGGEFELTFRNGDHLSVTGNSGTVIESADGELRSSSHCWQGFRETVAFLGDFQRALAGDSTEEVAALINFPLRINGQDGHRDIDQAEFVASFDEIFTPDHTRRLLDDDPRRVFCTAEGFMLDNGSVWASLDGLFAVLVEGP